MFKSFGYGCKIIHFYTLTKNIFNLFLFAYICGMEKQKRGRKPKPAHLKVHMLAAYLTKEQIDLIHNEFGNLTNAVKYHILSKYNGYRDSSGYWQPMDGQRAEVCPKVD
jgi:hypothetical protein